jgi:protoporphyrinogen oxidase
MKGTMGGKTKKVIVIGAGPAGLTAAWELVRCGHEVSILEQDSQYVGGLARTMSYKGFRFDIGAHRFFSKNPEISRWWSDRLPGDFVPVRRLTRILYRGRFFQYPLRAGEALFGLGIRTSMGCGLSYLHRKFSPIKPERSFEDWVCNRFGDHLYRIFFKTYTEKVWGMSCREISSDWASQRIKGLSLLKAVLDSLGVRQNTVKSLVDEFHYPRLGAGMMWEKTRDDILFGGGLVHMGRTVTELHRDGDRIVSVQTISASGKSERWSADEFIVSMPLRDCILQLHPAFEPEVLAAAKRLSYRDFVLVALIVKRNDLFPDNWIYVHDPTVKVARIENYNNWSKEMVSDPEVTCLELEYFCSQGDSLWSLNDDEWMELAKREMEQLGLALAREVSDGCVVKVKKAYPVYDSEYQGNVDVIRRRLARMENFQMIGRNGMHKYNNQDHSMLTGILAARNVNGALHDVWRVNTDAEYQEDGAAETGRLMPRQLAIDEIVKAPRDS